MSYKFQRLRERLRQSIAAGELAGKLPGERTLARQFHVNAKTLSKALTDLAAEGVLDRSIGRGTYVKGAKPARESQLQRILILAEPTDTLLPHIRQACPDHETALPSHSFRPSALVGFTGVLCVSPADPALLRNLAVRNIPVVSLGHEPTTYSTHAVSIDAQLAFARLSRDLILRGHRHFLAIRHGDATLHLNQLRTAAHRYGVDITAEIVEADGVVQAIQSGATALLCPSPAIADLITRSLADASIEIPQRASVAAFGIIGDAAPPCTGYFADARQAIELALDVLKSSPPRPQTIWLTGDYKDADTMSFGPAAPGQDEKLAFAAELPN